MSGPRMGAHDAGHGERSIPVPAMVALAAATGVLAALGAVVFGVVKLPKVTIYGVWKGKEGRDWHNENVELDCRSPKVQEMVERDRRIIDAFN